MDAADRMIEESMAAAREIVVPEGPGVEVEERVREMGRQGGAVRMGGRAGGRGRVVRWAIAAMVVLTIGGVWGLLGDGGAGRRGSEGSGVAFGEVLGRLRQVKTVTYRQVTTLPGGQVVVTRETVEMAGKYSRTEMLGPDGKGGERVRGVAIYNQGRMLNLDPERKVGTLTDYTNGGKDVPHRLSETHTLEGLINVNTQDAKALGERMEGGKKVVEYEVEKKDFGNEETYVVWVDAGTKLPVRVVETIRPLPEDIVGMVPATRAVGGAGGPGVVGPTVRELTAIQFDVPVEEGTFSVETPAGYVVTQERVGE